MAYLMVSSPSSQESVMTSLRDFAVANGWTLDNFTAAVVGVSRGVMSLHRGDCYVSFRWEGTESEGNKSIAMYQALGYNGANAATPWLQQDDSGNGVTFDSISSQRRVARIGSGPFVNLHLFAFDTDQISTNSAPTVYAVLEYEVGTYAHFGFGNIDKLNDFTGGEWVGGHEWSTSSQSDPVANTHTVLLDSLSTSDTSSATIHLEGLPGQDPSSKWGQVGNDTSPGNDRAGNPRVAVQGGVRANPYTYTFGRFIPENFEGFLPLHPCPVFYRRSGGNQVYMLGYMPNIRMIQMTNVDVAQEFTIGSITWVAFPVVRRVLSTLNVLGSRTMGIAYIKEVS